MDFKKISTIYFIGIKGVGMTMLAQFLKQRGYEVNGSDNPEVFMTDKVLKMAKIKVFKSFSIDNLPAQIDLVVYSSAYNKNNNVEVNYVLSAPQFKGKVLLYAEALGQVFSQYQGVAVCGSHGKTTTTAWLGYVLARSGKKPNVLVGSRVPQFKGSSLIGKSNIFVAETDEYQNKLQYFYPFGVLLNNIDYDHPDYFKTKAAYTQVFKEFIKKIPRSGFLVANAHDVLIRKILSNTQARISTYSLEASDRPDYLAIDIKMIRGRQVFTVFYKQKFLGKFSISLLGEHNIYNALAVIAAARYLQVPLLKIKTHLGGFTGTERRLQILGTYNQALIIDDYAHHPTEIQATLNGLKQKYSEKRLITVFHPHTFTRTKALLTEFSQSFSQAQELIVLDIYGSAREKQGGVSSLDLVRRIEAYNKKTGQRKQLIRHLPTLPAVTSYLRRRLKANDLLVLMGAGDVFRVGEDLLAK